MENQWDVRLDACEDLVERLTGQDRANLVLDAVELTIPLLEPPCREFLPVEHAALVDSALRFRAENHGTWHVDTGFAADWLGRYDRLPQVAVRPGAGPLLMALVRLFESAAKPMETDDAMEALSSCYEAVLLTRARGRFSLQDEEDEPRCREAIQVQVGLLVRYVGGSGD